MARVANGFFELLIRARLFFMAEMAGFTSYNCAVLLREMSSAGLHVVVNLVVRARVGRSLSRCLSHQR